MWLAVQYPTQSWKIWEIVSAAEPSSCWPPSEPNKANHESIINIYTSIFWEHLHNHHTRSGRVEFLKSRPFLGKRRVKLLQQPDAYIVGLHCCLIYKRKQAAYLCSLMSLVMLYFFAFSLAFHFFFSLYLPPYTIISKKQESHNYPDPYISQKWPIRYSSLQKRKTAVLRDSKVMWMELHQPNKQNKIIQYNLIVWLKWGSSLNGTTIRLREIYKVSCRAHIETFYFFLRSNAGFKVNISRSDAIRMMSAVKMIKMAIMIWQKKNTSFPMLSLRLSDLSRAVSVV